MKSAIALIELMEKIGVGPSDVFMWASTILDEGEESSEVSASSAQREVQVAILMLRLMLELTEQEWNGRPAFAANRRDE